MFREIVARQRTLCISKPEDEFVLQDEGILAAPIIDKESGEVLGMLKIEKMNFFDLHFSNIQSFQLLCEWIADAYVQAQRFTAAVHEVEWSGTHKRVS
jgi:hypothetical protein